MIGTKTHEQKWREGSFKVAVSRGGSLVLNSKFHRKPAQFSVQRLRFLHVKCSSAVLDFLQA